MYEKEPEITDEERELLRLLDEGIDISPLPPDFERNVLAALSLSSQWSVQKTDTEPEITDEERELLRLLDEGIDISPANQDRNIHTQHSSGSSSVNRGHGTRVLSSVARSSSDARANSSNISVISRDRINVISQDALLTPAAIKRHLPITPKTEEFVLQSRTTLQRILDRQDPRLFVIVGPNSIHDLRAARDYAQRLKQLAAEVADTLFIVMRVYFEKPRTSIGWKGLINDPYMNDSFRIEDGLKMARGLLLELAEMGLPAGTEALDPISPQYISDLITWYAIGARAAESQTHIEMASGLSAPVGFKNNTDGNLDVAINAMLSACRPHSFLSINQDGQCAIIRTKGNRYGHVVLRGGGGKPNYDSVTVALCEQALAVKKLSTNIVVDCSHENSRRDPALQPLVLNDGVHQILEGNQSLIGFMLESNINFGKQAIPADLSQLQYGVSVTDGCIDWATTEKILLETRSRLKDILSTRL